MRERASREEAKRRAKGEVSRAFRSMDFEKRETARQISFNSCSRHFKLSAYDTRNAKTKHRAQIGISRARERFQKDIFRSISIIWRFYHPRLAQAALVSAPSSQPSFIISHVSSSLYDPPPPATLSLATSPPEYPPPPPGKLHKLLPRRTHHRNSWYFLRLYPKKFPLCYNAMPRNTCHLQGNPRY